MAVAAPDADDLKNIEQLPEADRKLALAQRICPVTGAALGSMGVPVKITLRGQTGLPVLQRVHGQGQAKPRRNAEETGGCRVSEPTLTIHRTRNSCPLRTSGENP